MSRKYTLNNEDLKNIARNAFIFSAPALLVFLMTLQAGGTPKEAVVALQVWVLNTAVDALRKFTTGK